MRRSARISSGNAPPCWFPQSVAICKTTSSRSLRKKQTRSWHESEPKWPPRRAPDTRRPQPTLQGRPDAPVATKLKLWHQRARPEGPAMTTTAPATAPVQGMPEIEDAGHVDVLIVG